MDPRRIYEILQKNARKPFVQRILEPEKYPSIPAPGGKRATHDMTWSSLDDGSAIVYPNVTMQPDGTLKWLKGKESYSHARKTGDFIPFESQDEADAFSKEYKRYWVLREALK
jgi:hypothetical protein